MEALNGASRCLVCNRLPTLTLEPAWSHNDTHLPETIILRCHIYSAEGSTIDQALAHWNQTLENSKIAFLKNAIRLDPPAEPEMTVCPYCQQATRSTHHAEPKRSYTQCCACKMIKSEDSPISH